MLKVLLLAAVLQTQNPGFVTGIVRANGQPATGVRVYAMSINPSTQPDAVPTALESQVTTDSNGRYRLEVPSGSYYIASGAVSAPTFFPGTTDAKAARVITVTAGTIVEGIDFGSFLAAPLENGIALPPGSTGTLSGTVRYSDGRAAPNIPVAAFSPTRTAGAAQPAPARASNSTNTSAAYALFLARISFFSPRTLTDINGMFVLRNVPPDTYYLAAGFDDAPALYPGTSNLSSAKSITTTPTTNLSGIDIIIPADLAGVAVSGRVTTIYGEPAAGASMKLTLQVPNTGLPMGLLGSEVKTAAVRPDGTFEFVSVSPGTYTTEVQLLGVTPKAQTLVVEKQPIRDLNFALPVSLLSGRILMEDGSPVPDVQAFNEAMITTVGSSTMITTTIFPISQEGTFSRVVEAGEYRFNLRYLPGEYTIRSMRAGSIDLLKDHLTTSTASTKIEIRVASASSSAEGSVKFSGVIRDFNSGKPPGADRITLCCVATGPVEGFSTKVREDGSFEFISIMPGDYVAELTAKGEPTTSATDLPVARMLFLTKADIRIGNDGATGVTLNSTAGLAQVNAVVTIADGSVLSRGPDMRIVFQARSNAANYAAVVSGPGYIASLPRGDHYAVVVSPPAGYKVISFEGPPVSGTLEIRTDQASSLTMRIVLERLP